MKPEDSAPLFSETSARFQMNLLVVAEYAESLKESDWAQNSSMNAVLE